MSDEKRCACGRFLAVPEMGGQVADGVWHLESGAPTCEVASLRAQLASAQAERDEARAEAGRRYPIETIRQMHEDGLAAVRATAAERDALRRERDRLADMHERIVEERDAALKRAEGWEEEARVYCQNATHQREQREASESRAADLARWQREVADGLGFLNQPEGQSGYEVADPATIIEAWLGLRRRSR